MRKVIITGANGFLGAALCKELSSNNVKIIAVVRDKNSNVEAIKELKGLRIVYCDLENFKCLPEMIPDRDADALYHFAWTGSAGPLRGDINVQVDNIRYTCDLIKTCYKMNCKKFIFAASIMEYEVHAAIRANQKLGVNSLYSIAKASADYMARVLAEEMNVEYFQCVISNVYGPGERSPRLINLSLRNMLNGEHCSFSAGEQMYDFIYIDDAAKVFFAIGERGGSHHTYYIGSSKPRPLKYFLLEMRDQVDPLLSIGLGEIPFDGTSLSYKEFDIGAVKEDTGVVAEVSFSEGICRTIDWIKKE